jgi:hypothetical protein
VFYPALSYRVPHICKTTHIYHPYSLKEGLLTHSHPQTVTQQYYIGDYIFIGIFTASVSTPIFLRSLKIHLSTFVLVWFSLVLPV